MVYTLIDLVQFLSKIFYVLILARVVLSWISPNPGNPLVGFIYRLTEPIMAPVRKLIPSAGGMDFSPMLVLAGIWVAETVLVRLLYGMA